MSQLGKYSAVLYVAADVEGVLGAVYEAWRASRGEDESAVRPEIEAPETIVEEIEKSAVLIAESLRNAILNTKKKERR